MSNGRDKWEGRIEANLEHIKSTQLEIKNLLSNHIANCGKTVSAVDKRMDKITNRITKVEVKSSILGTLAGIVGGFLAGLTGLFKG